MTNFGLTHVLLAAYVRTVAKYPGLNRFLAGQKVYSRGEDIQFCMTAKKEMSSDAPDSIFKLHLSPRDTAQDVYRKFNAAVEEIKDSPLDSDFDNTARALNLIPGVLLKFTVWLLRTMDYFGLLPGFLLEVSPFHGSVFFTSMGSLGIPLPFTITCMISATCRFFGAFGCKRRTNEVLADGTVVQRKVRGPEVLPGRADCGRVLLCHRLQVYEAPDAASRPPGPAAGGGCAGYRLNVPAPRLPPRGSQGSCRSGPQRSALLARGVRPCPEGWQFPVKWIFTCKNVAFPQASWYTKGLNCANALRKKTAVTA